MVYFTMCTYDKDIVYFHKPLITSSDSVVEDIREMLLQRSEVGLKKYGKTTVDNPLELKAWLTHALEEALDQAVYLRRSIVELEKLEKK